MRYTYFRLTFLKLGLFFLPGILLIQFAIDNIAKIQHRVAIQSPFVLEITPNEIKSPSREALLVSGHPGEGCFLFLIRDAQNHAKIAYDSWGTGGPVSESIDLIPGKPLRLQMIIPALDSHIQATHPALARLVIALDGRTLINKQVHYFAQSKSEVYIGYNPIGGSVCGDLFSGTIRLDNKTLWSVASNNASIDERLLSYITHNYQVLLYILKCAGLIFSLFSAAVLAGQYSIFKSDDLLKEPNTRWTIVSIVAIIAGIVFYYFNTQGSFRLFESEPYTSFYDYQAVSLLHGRLDIPLEAISGEAFVYHGLYYGYFGLAPAILRLPFALLHFPYGILSRFFMCGYFIISVWYAYSILSMSYKHLKGEDSEPPLWATVLVILNTALGSTLLFLGSRSYFYHEAILCGAAFSIVSIYYSLRFLYTEGRSSFLPAFICALLSIHARATSGIFCFGFLMLVAFYICIRVVSKRRKSFLIIAACLFGVFTFNLVGYLKFKDFSGFPLKYNVQYTPERLARFGGKEFQLINFPHNFYQYIIGDTVYFAKHFPYIKSDNNYSAPRAYSGPQLDMVEPTISIKWCMPGLLIVCFLGSIYTLYRSTKLQVAIVILWGSVTPMMIILLSAVVVSHRYTGDFCPFLISTSAVSLATLSGYLSRFSRYVIGVISVVTCFSILITVMWCFRFQYGGPALLDGSRLKVLANHFDQFFGVNIKH